LQKKKKKLNASKYEQIKMPPYKRGNNDKFWNIKNLKMSNYQPLKNDFYITINNEAKTRERTRMKLIKLQFFFIKRNTF